jgi:chromatin segregation and condensation protein Rec8/ScpA/Scc1 (kleisin family)
VSVSEAVAELIALPEGDRSTSFRALVRTCRTRIDVIVRFLALLELCKMGRIALGQGHTFGDLQISWLSVEAPLAGVASGRGLAELGGYEIDDYEG